MEGAYNLQVAAQKCWATASLIKEQGDEKIEQVDTKSLPARKLVTDIPVSMLNRENPIKSGRVSDWRSSKFKDQVALQKCHHD